MRIINCQQGSQEWLRVRAGIPTASEFDRIFTPGGKASTSWEGYLYDLLAERIMGRPRVAVVTMWMERGTELEKRAREFYEFTRDATVAQVGFVSNDDGTVGVSPDGLVGDDGLVEIKCPSDGQHVGYLLASKGTSVDKKYKVQIQGQLWITGRKWVDIISFHPEMPEALFRVERDEQYIEELADHVRKFSRVLENKALELTEQGIIRPKEEAPPLPELSFGLTDEDVAAAMKWAAR